MNIFRIALKKDLHHHQIFFFASKFKTLLSNRNCSKIRRLSFLFSLHNMPSFCPFLSVPSESVMSSFVSDERAQCQHRLSLNDVSRNRQKNINVIMLTARSQSDASFTSILV